MRKGNEMSLAAPMTNRTKTAEIALWKSEGLFVAAITVIVLVLTSLPYLYGSLSTPADKHFMGIMLDVPDHAQYFSWMRDLSTANLVSNKLTPEANQPLFFNLLWWGMGRLGRVLSLDYASMYQVLRISAAALFLALIYLVSAWFLKDRAQRRTAFLVATFTSGFGWVLVAIKCLTHSDLLFPLDVYVAEGNTFLGVLGYPHFIAAALYIFVYYLILKGQAKGQLRYAVYAGLVALFLGWQHTYDLVSVYAVLFVYAGLIALRDRRLPRYLIFSGIIVGLLSCSAAVYSVWLTTVDPVWKAVLAQFTNAGVFTPNPLHLPILLGAAFLLAIYTTIRKNPLRLAGKSDGEIFLIGWFMVTFLLVYLPVNYQIHLINGWQVPIAILATQGLYDYLAPMAETKLLPHLGNLKRWISNGAAVRKVLSISLLVIVLPTNVYLLAWRFVDLSRHDYPYYLYTDEMGAMSWLSAHAQPDNVVLASLNTGQYVPMLTGAHAYLAHWAQTVDYYDKSKAVQEFFSTQTTDAQRMAILRQGRVTYVLYGPSERQIGDPNLAVADYLKAVYSNTLVRVYQVEPEKLEVK